MPDIIKLLPENIANQIAAGEVVQRPASVVKELMENSIDAKAKTIKLYIRNAGKTLIQVVDDGIGMSETDARMCFERHATSKIQVLDDLYRINTLGFRGEAMASIAAVAQLEMKTRKKGEEHGTLLIIEGSNVKSHEPCACQEGTSISVKNLFFNVPARRNFLKSATIELRHITDEFIRVALPNPEISFHMFNEDEEVYHLKASNLKQRIVNIFGRKYEEALIQVSEKSTMFSVSGFAGKPEYARKARGEQFFFANGRFIKSPYLHHAVVNAYEDLLQSDSHPFYVLFLELPPDRLDINVHPTKTEIKFTDEKAIYALLRTIVRKALSNNHIAPSLNFDEEEPVRQAMALNDRRETLSFDTQLRGKPEGSTNVLRQKASKEEWEDLYKILSLANGEEKGEELPEEPESFIEGDELTQKPVLQLHRKYIITTLKSGLMIIHQQLAHERILYENYLEQLNSNSNASQRLLFPEMIELPSHDAVILKEILPDILSLGFEVEEFGKNTFVLNGLPANLAIESNILEKLIEEYKEQQQGEGDKKEALARALAKKTAIGIGRILEKEEMNRIIDELFACSMPYYSPDGKPALITIPAAELDKKFKKS